MTYDQYIARKRHDYAGRNDGTITPSLKGWYWTLKLDPKTGATTLVHAKTIGDLG
jgi:hypothetical protein